MSYDPSSVLELHRIILDGYRDQVPGADVSEDSEIYARAYGFAGAAAMVSAGLRYVENQIFIASADSQNLDRWVVEYGIEPRKAATVAGGIVTFTGEDGTVVDGGLIAVSDAGVEYMLSGGVIAEGVLSVSAEATTAGVDGNLTEGDVLTLQSPPLGVDSTVTVAEEGLSGGTDLESDEELRARLLVRRQAGSAGGTQADYQQWALSVAGVFEAHVLPLRRGLGTVDVAIFTEGEGGTRTAAGPVIVSAVQTYLDSVRPVTADVLAITATAVTRTVTVHLLLVKTGYDEDEVITGIEEAVAAFFLELQTGDVLYRSQLRVAIGNVAGVADFDLLLPDEDETPTLSESVAQIYVLGTLTVHGTDWEAPT